MHSECALLVLNSFVEQPVCKYIESCRSTAATIPSLEGHISIDVCVYLYINPVVQTASTNILFSVIIIPIYYFYVSSPYKYFNKLINTEND